MAKSHRELRSELLSLKEHALLWEVRGDRTREGAIRRKLKPAVKIAKQLDDQAEQRLIEGRIRFLESFYDDAKLLFDAALRVVGRKRVLRAEILGWRSRANSFRKDIVQAFKDSEEALLIRPNDPFLLHRRGAVRMDQAKYRDAILAFREAIEKGENHPLSVWGYTNISYCQHRLGRMTDSYNSLRRAIGQSARLGLEPVPTLLNNLGVLYHEFAQDTGDTRKEALAGWLYAWANEMSEETETSNYNYGLHAFRRHYMDKDERSLREASEAFKKSLPEFEHHWDVDGAIAATLMSSLVSMSESLRKDGDGTLSDKNEQPAWRDKEHSKLLRRTLNFLLEDVDHFISKSRAVEQERKAMLCESHNPLLQTKQENFVLVLKKWDLGAVPDPRSLTKAYGGGYYIRGNDRGVVIDPGPGFLSSLAENGIPLSEIDDVIVTHPHISHSRDLEPLILGLAELRRRRISWKTVRFFVTNETLVKYGHLANAGGVFSDIELIRPDVSIPMDRGESLSKQTPIIHTLRTQRRNEPPDSPEHIGCLIEFRGARGFQVAYLSDTSYSEDIISQLPSSEVDLLLLPIGRVTLKELITPLEMFFDSESNPVGKLLPHLQNTVLPLLGYRNFAELQDIVYRRDWSISKLYDPHHLGFLGAVQVIEAVRPKVAVLTDFRPEMGKLRHRLAQSVNEFLASNGTPTRVVTGDVGLTLTLPTSQFYCNMCSALHPLSELREVPSRDPDESLLYLCSQSEPKPVARFLHSTWGRPLDLLDPTDAGSDLPTREEFLRALMLQDAPESD